jgi:hypothetical protein
VKYKETGYFPKNIKAREESVCFPMTANLPGTIITDFLGSDGTIPLAHHIFQLISK